jgi:PNKP adenylyltransferase domain, C-terminal region
VIHGQKLVAVTGIEPVTPCLGSTRLDSVRSLHYFQLRPEYLRIIYGPEYLLPENLERLRSRSVSTKRSLALREFALGIEALERFVRQEPLRRVHECVFGVLALESEPVDPRL